MIDNQLYTKIHANGLLLDHYFILSLIRDNKKIPETKRVQGLLNLLAKLGYVQDDNLTDKAKELLSVTPTLELMEFPKWALGLHKRCIAKLVQLTNKKQITDKIKNTTYSFMPNGIDFARKLSEAVVAYKLEDRDRVEACLMRYIESRKKANSWFPMLKYYILKEKSSDLATDYENFDDTTTKPAYNKYTTL